MLETELEVSFYILSSHLTFIFQLSPEKLETILYPWEKYRLQWDDMIEDATIIATYPDQTYLIRHLIKKRLGLSARESIDVVKVIKVGDKIVLGSCGSSHGQYPPSKTHVRTHQYIGGYIIEPLPDGRSRFTMIFHADLNLPGPKLIASLADRFKPRLMMENINDLKNGIEKFRQELWRRPL